MGKQPKKDFILEHIRSVCNLLAKTDNMPMYPVNRPTAVSVSSVEIDKDGNVVMDNIAEIIASLKDKKGIVYNNYKDVKKYPKQFEVPDCGRLNPNVNGVALLDMANRIFDNYMECLIAARVQYVLCFINMGSH